MPLEEEAQRHLTAAEGYVELGMFLDANTELEEIDPDVRCVPEVLTVRTEIYRALEKWDLMQAVTRKLANHDPDEVQWVALLAYATRRAESIDAARSILLDAVERHPGAAILHYNLACYECQLGELEVAKSRLNYAFKLDKNLRTLAMDDPDLEPVWSSLRK